MLLKAGLTAHYNLPSSTIANITIQTSEIYFEIEDDESRETKLHIVPGAGVAKYKNDEAFEVIIVNYDKFLTSLPITFQDGKKRCDLVVYTNSNNRYFLLNELKDRKYKNRIRRDSLKQLQASLNCMMAVPAIRTFADGFEVKQCCYFNKQAAAPLTIIATAAFNQINQIVPNGLRMSDPIIEGYGFEFYEYAGNAIFKMVS